MKTYFIQEGNLSPFDSCTNIVHSFDLNDETEQLNISFSYEPKTLYDEERAKEIMKQCIEDYSMDEQEDFIKRFEGNMPLNNLLTLSVDDPSEFRGAVHRHPNNQQLFINKNTATHGLIAGDIPKGKWHITISTHCIVTEKCSYKLHIWGGGIDDEELDS